MSWNDDAGEALVLMQVQCEQPLLGADGEQVWMEVGESLYAMTCDFDDDVDAEMDHMQGTITWTCPRCGAGHVIVDAGEDPFAVDYDDDLF